MTQKYDHQEIEKKWQKRWEESRAFKAQDDSAKPKTYVLDMFPYPSGEGLHVGHPKGYIATDIYSRHMRMRGHNVLHPMGWDAFGLPAENYALKNKIHPRVAVEQNIANFKQQLAHIGFDYDWSREINTTDPGYYKWTQWIFLQMFKKGLAYQSNEPINWCPSCMTGLANEDLDGDVCERCGTKVEKKGLPQWVLKITAYADRMLEDLDALKWPEYIKEAQRNWIGRSEGAEIEFEIRHPMSDFSQKMRVFTTRPDTLFGATYMVVAPEHPLVEQFADKEVKAYVAAAAQKTEIERGAAKEKTGVELKGVKAINPANKEELPIYVADYVLWGYGTGAIMAVPAHDERDFEFAQKFNLPIKQVIEPTYEQTTEPGKIKEGEPFDHREAIIAIVKHWAQDKYVALKWKQVAWGTFITGGIEEGQTPETAALAELKEEVGYTDVKFIKDFGVVHGKFYHVPKKTNRNAHAHVVYLELQSDKRTKVSAEENAIHEVLWLSKDELKKFLTPDTHQHALRWLVGEQDIYTATGTLTNSGQFDRLESDEAKKKITEFVGGKITTTYKLKDWVFSRQRYWGEPIPIIHCPKDGAVPVPEAQLPVLLPEVKSYEPSGTGESPLAAIVDWVNTTCPKCGGAAKRETNTMPQWAGSSWYYLRFMDPHNDNALVDPKVEKYWAPVDVYVGGDHAVRHLIYARFWHKFLYDIGSVSTIEPFARLEFLGFILAEDGRKMSKRYGNVINPTEVVEKVGADVFRLYEMFMGPFENTTAWNQGSINGVSRFIERVWKAQGIVQDAPVLALDTIVEQTVKKVGEDIEAFKFNTAVSQMMILLNAIEKEKAIGKEHWMKFLQVLNPFAPHICYELAELAGFASVAWESWPVADESKLTHDTVTIGVQVNGRVRGTITVALTAPESEVLAAGQAAVAKWLESKEVKKALYIKGKIVTLVV